MRRTGDDVTIVATGAMVGRALAAVRFLDEAEISDEDRRKIYHRNAERIFGIPDCAEPG